MAEEHCANCDAPLHGPYCHRCGQQDLDLDRPFFGMAREWLDHLLALDARLWRTLGPLVARPGWLTVEYLAGRRVRYVLPLRLYLFASVAMFLALAWGGYSIVQRTSGDGVAVTIREAPGERPPDASAESAPPTGAAPSAAAAAEGDEGWLGERLGRFLGQPEEVVNDIYRRRLAQTLILLVFVFALFTRALWWRPHRHYFPHLVFSMHVHAAAFLGIVATTALGAMADRLGVGLVARSLRLALLVYLFVYLFLALRRVFGRGRLATAWRFLALGVAYLVALALTLLATMILAAWTP
jgi:hypothetical protein